MANRIVSVEFALKIKKNSHFVNVLKNVSPGKFRFVEITIRKNGSSQQGTLYHLMIDIGSSVNLIPRKLFEKHFPLVSFRSATNLFLTNQVQRLRHGKILLQMSWQGGTSTEEIIVTERGQPLNFVGLPAFENLQLHRLWQFKMHVRTFPIQQNIITKLLFDLPLPQ